MRSTLFFAVKAAPHQKKVARAEARVEFRSAAQKKSSNGIGLPQLFKKSVARAEARVEFRSDARDVRFTLFFDRDRGPDGFPDGPPVFRGKLTAPARTPLGSF